MMSYREWLVTACCSCCALSGLATMYNGNIFVEDIRQTFDVTYTATAIIPSIWGGTISMGFIPAILFQKIGKRRVFLLGGLVGCLSFTGASFSRSFSVTAILFGTVGITVGVVSIGGIFALEREISHDNFPTALAVFTAIASLGTLIVPFLYTWMSDAFTFRGAVFIFGAIQLHLLITAAIFSDKTTASNDKSLGVAFRKCWHESATLVRDSRFLSLCGLLVVNSLSFNTYNSFATSYLISDQGLTEHQASNVVGLTSGVCAAGRVSVAILPRKCPRLIAMAIVMLFTGLAVILFGSLETSRLGVFYIIGVIFWFSQGLSWNLHAVAAADIFLDKFDLAYSITLLVQGITSFVTPIFTGTIADVFGSFRNPLVFAGAAEITISALIACWLAYRKHETEEKQSVVINDTIKSLVADDLRMCKCN